MGFLFHSLWIGFFYTAIFLAGFLEDVPRPYLSSFFLTLHSHDHYTFYFHPITLLLSKCYQYITLGNRQAGSLPVPHQGISLLFASCSALPFPVREDAYHPFHHSMAPVLGTTSPDKGEGKSQREKTPKRTRLMIFMLMERHGVRSRQMHRRQ